MLSSNYGGLQDLSNLERNVALFDNKKEALRDNHEIPKDPSELEIWKQIYGKTDRPNRGNTAVATLEEEEILRFKKAPYEQTVYDITTGTGNFFANGILIHNCPIDHSPVSGQITGKIQNSFKNIAISKFGQRELAKKNIESTYIPNGVDTEVFHPLSKEEKAEAKKAFFLDPDDFVVGITAMNRSRKGIPRMLRGYKKFLSDNPDVHKSKLLLWTNIMPTAMSQDVEFGISDVGEYLLPEIIDLGLNDNVMWPNWNDVMRVGGLQDYDPTSRWDMLRLYGASDCHLLTSFGEGAGMTYLEAGAMGIPSVYTNYAAAPEYAGPAGFSVNASDYVIMNTPGVRRYLPDVDGIADALTKAYNADRDKLARIAVRHAKKYDWKVIMSDYWKPFLEDCERELCPLITKGGLDSWAKK